MPAKAEICYSPQSEVEKVQKFGAFLQVFEKREDDKGIPHISTMTYYLPEITTEQARQLIRGVAGQENAYRRGVSYESPSGELMFQTFAGATFDNAMLHRFLAVPATMLDINQTERKKQLIGGVLREFNDGLRGKRYESAKASEGKDIYAFSYRQEGNNLFSKNVKGIEGKPMSQLALEGDIEHEDLLIAQEQALAKMKEGIVLAIDKSKTVSLCCVKFFLEKLTEKARSFLSLFLGPLALLNPVGEDEETCDKCKKPSQECKGHIS